MSQPEVSARRARGMSAGMRPIHAVAAVGMAVAAPFGAPIVLNGLPSAHADLSGYRRCVGNIPQLPISEPDPKNMQRVGEIQQDLKSGVSPAAETQKVTQMGFDPRTANTIVQCVLHENP